MASSFLAELHERALPAAFRANGAPAAAGPQRLLPLAGTAALIVAIAAAASARALDRIHPAPLAGPHERARRLIAERLPSNGSGEFVLTDLAAAADLVRSGALAEAAGVPLPTVSLGPPASPPLRLGGRRKRP
jgi:histidine ammonia-lyase